MWWVRNGAVGNALRIRQVAVVNPLEACSASDKRVHLGPDVIVVRWVSISVLVLVWPIRLASSSLSSRGLVLIFNYPRNRGAYVRIISPRLLRKRGGCRFQIVFSCRLLLCPTLCLTSWRCYGAVLRNSWFLQLIMYKIYFIKLEYCDISCNFFVLRIFI